MPAVLVATDDPIVEHLAEQALAQGGYAVCTARGAEDAIRASLSAKVVSVVIDAALDQASVTAITEWFKRERESECGLVFLLPVRSRPGSLPIDPESDLLLAMPVTPEEIRSAVERSIARADGAETSERVVIGHIQLDRRNHCIGNAETSIDLTPQEERMVEYLAINQGRLVSVDELATEVLGREAGAKATAVIRTQIQRIREKLEPLANGHALIETYPRRGYVMRG